jgi:sentrin-specific protease 1
MSGSAGGDARLAPDAIRPICGQRAGKLPWRVQGHPHAAADLTLEAPRARVRGEPNYPGVLKVDCTLFSNWIGVNPGKILQTCTEPIYEEDIKSLQDGTWLNDGAINWYMNLLCLARPKTHYFSSFTYQKILDELNSEKGLDDYKIFIRYAKGVILSEYNLVFFPIHKPRHWCLAVAYPQDHRLAYYDPRRGKDKQCLQLLKEFLQARGKAIQNDCDLNAEWTEQFIGPNTSPQRIPQQTDSHSCGLFACALADVLSACSPDCSWPESWGYSQKEMNMFRRLVRCLFEAY